MKGVTLTHQLCAVLMASTVTACTQQITARSNPLNYVYPPHAQKVVTPAPTQLRLPLRIGIAFVPDAPIESHASIPWGLSSQRNGLSEADKVRLMDRVAERFKSYKFVQSINILPSQALTDSGGFAELEKLGTIYGIDVIALLSYNQNQYSDPSKKSLAYWTGIGLYVVNGDRTETQTVLNAMVFDIASRRLLFHGHGASELDNVATATKLSKRFRVDSATGYAQAADTMMANLDKALDHFRVVAREQGRAMGVELVKPDDYDALPDRMDTPADSASAAPELRSPPPPSTMTPAVPAAMPAVTPPTMPSSRPARAISDKGDFCQLLGWPAANSRAECRPARNAVVSHPTLPPPRQKQHLLNAQRD